jgi:hypothetical protein
MSRAPVEDALASWSAKDKRATFSSRDHVVVDDTLSIRALIVDLVERDLVGDDLFDACAQLGRMTAERGGSPTLASLTLDQACSALGAHDPTWLVSARAALFEGFAATLLEISRAATLESWEFPRCAVTLGGDAVAIAAGLPSDEPDVIDAWAARTARSLALLGVRRVAVSGAAEHRAAVADAVGLVGVEVTESSR